MKNMLLALMAALITALFAVAPPNIYADSVWPKEAEEKPDFRHMIYTIRRGDKLEHIARNHSSSSYKISVANIIALNLILIKNPNRILVGQKLRLPVYYAKEVQAVVPTMVQAAVEAAVAPKEAALVKTKRTELALSALLVLTITFLAYLIFLYIPDKIRAQKNIKTEPENEPSKLDKFLTYPDEITALLQRCTGRDVATILESELVEVPRNPGSAIMNKKKLMNLKDLMHNNPELYDIPLESWSEHLAVKINGVDPASAKSA